MDGRQWNWRQTFHSSTSFMFRRQKQSILQLFGIRVPIFLFSSSPGSRVMYLWPDCHHDSKYTTSFYSSQTFLTCLHFSSFLTLDASSCPTCVWGKGYLDTMSTRVTVDQRRLCFTWLTRYIVDECAVALRSFKITIARSGIWCSFYKTFHL